MVGVGLSHRGGRHRAPATRPRFDHGTGAAGRHRSPRTRPESDPVKLSRRLFAPQRLYLAALSLSGAGALVSVTLPVDERGVLAACTVGATLGAGIGSFSVDTFLLSRPAGWVADRGRPWVVALVVGSVALSVSAAGGVTAVEGVGSYLLAMSGAAALTVLNASASLMLRRQRFVLVYAVRAGGGAALICGYGALYATGQLSGVRWAAVWLGAQTLTAVAIGGCAAVVSRRIPTNRDVAGAPVVAGGRGSDLLAAGKLHTGICAQMLTFRLDQVLLARFAGAGALGGYALAVAALEFSQAGAVVMAQKILAERERPTPVQRPWPVIRATLPIALAAVLGLAGLGALAPGYRGIWLAGLLLVPGCVAVSLSKTWSANLLRRRGEQATTNVALLTLAASVPAYLGLIPWAGALGAAAASSVVYSIHAGCSRVSLRSRPEPNRMLEAA